MKIYISADMEGITGASRWEEVMISKPGYNRLQKQMTAEVNAACEGCFESGVEEIWVKDAHDTGANLLIDELPEYVNVIKGWSGHPLSMVQEIDETFDGMIAIGYHSKGMSGGNPLSHTMSSGKIMNMKLNGKIASEFLLNYYAALSFDVPVILATGDEELCKEINELDKQVKTVAVFKGVGDSTINISPNLAIKHIKSMTIAALSKNIKMHNTELPNSFSFEIQYKQHKHAYHASFYPGAKLKDDVTVSFNTKEYFEVFRFMSFVI